MPDANKMVGEHFELDSGQAPTLLAERTGGWGPAAWPGLQGTTFASKHSSKVPGQVTNKQMTYKVNFSKLQPSS